MKNLVLDLQKILNGIDKDKIKIGTKTKKGTFTWICFNNDNGTN